MLKNKIFLSLITLVIIFSIGLLSSLAYFFVKIRDIKEPLISTLQDYIDGELKIGSAEVKFFPTGIDLKDIELIAPGDKRPSATVKRAKLRFNFMPLVRKKIEGRLIIEEPDIYLRRPRRGPSNMEVIFSPLTSQANKEESATLDKFWWKRVAIKNLSIKDAHFLATKEGSKEVIELKNVQIEANNIRFDSGKTPAKIKIRYDLPKFSQVPMELETELIFDEQNHKLTIKNGAFFWGPFNISLSGSALLPSKKNKNSQLDLKIDAKELPLKKLAKVLKGPIPLRGDLSLNGVVSGSPFKPKISLKMKSPLLNIQGRTLKNFKTELIKSGPPLGIRMAHFEIFGGVVEAQGEVLGLEKASGKLKLRMKSLSLSAMSGKKGNPARLSGNLNLKSPNLKSPQNYSGGGTITVGPIILPVVNLKDKVRVAEILSTGMGLGQMVNVGLLSSSANVIGTRIEQVKAKVTLAKGNLSLRPFSMANGHFSAVGTGKIIQQKSISGGGTFTLNRRVTRQLITDPLLRRVLTKGSDRLSFPFTIAGPLGDPKISVDSGYIKSQVAKATVVVLQKQALGNLQPQRMLNAALKDTPLGDPNNPLGQILGTAPRQTQTSTRSTRTSSRTRSKQGTTTKSTSASGGSVLDQLIFGK